MTDDKSDEEEKDQTLSFWTVFSSLQQVLYFMVLDMGHWTLYMIIFS